MLTIGAGVERRKTPPKQLYRRVDHGELKRKVLLELHLEREWLVRVVSARAEALRRDVPGVPDEARQKGKGEVMNPLFLPFCTRYVGI